MPIGERERSVRIGHGETDRDTHWSGQDRERQRTGQDRDQSGQDRGLGNRCSPGGGGSLSAVLVSLLSSFSPKEYGSDGSALA